MPNAHSSLSKKPSRALERQAEQRLRRGQRKNPCGGCGTCRDCIQTCLRLTAAQRFVTGQIDVQTFMHEWQTMRAAADAK